MLAFDLGNIDRVGLIPDGQVHRLANLLHQCLHDGKRNVIQSTSRALKEQVTFEASTVASKEWGGYPILTFAQVPDIDVLMMPRQNEPPLGAAEP